MEERTPSTAAGDTDATLRRLKAKYPPPPPKPKRRPRRAPLFSRRVVAGLVDLLVLAGISFVFGEFVIYPLVAGQPGWASGPVDLLANALAEFCGVAAVLLLMAVTEVGIGRSPGKWWMNLLVIHRSGYPLDLPHRLLRHVARWSPVYVGLLGNLANVLEASTLPAPAKHWQIAAYIPLAIPALFIEIGWLGVFANDGQTLHDIIARTRVIDPRGETPDLPLEADGRGFDVVPTAPPATPANPSAGPASSTPDH